VWVRFPSPAPFSTLIPDSKKSTAAMILSRSDPRSPATGPSSRAGMPATWRRQHQEFLPLESQDRVNVRILSGAAGLSRGSSSPCTGARTGLDEGNFCACSQGAGRVAGNLRRRVCCQDVETTWTTEVGQRAYIDLYPIATGSIGALEGYGPGLADTVGRSIVESCLIDI
jgi:hypothetical protein